MIEGVVTRKLKVVPDERGFLMEMLRSDYPEFQKFGQVYLTVGYPEVVKGWHYHKKQTDNFFVVKGMAKVVLYDMRENSRTKGEINEFFLGEQNPTMVLIPPMVVHGFKAVGPEPGNVFGQGKNLPRIAMAHEIPYVATATVADLR
ncbi:MAG: dTDP-4-dehydrorhamnose 3,5-epimerase family protein, partial [Planctomycetota bacterium]